MLLNKAVRGVHLSEIVTRLMRVHIALSRVDVVREGSV